jgi:hypothetical protein
MDDHTGRGQSLIKRLSAALFGLVLISFVLKFVTFTVEGVPAASVTGVQFVTGAPLQDIATPQVRGIAGLVSRFPQVGATVQSILNDHIGSIPGTWLAGLVVLCAIVGLGASFLKSRKSALLPGVAAAIALVALAVLRVGIDRATASKGQRLTTAEYGIGYYLMGLFLLAALLLNSYLAWTAYWPTVGRSGRGSARTMEKRKSLQR